MNIEYLQQYNKLIDTNLYLFNEEYNILYSIPNIYYTVWNLFLISNMTYIFFNNSTQNLLPPKFYRPVFMFPLVGCLHYIRPDAYYYLIFLISKSVFNISNSL